MQLGGGPSPATAPQAGPPGTVQCPKCGEWSKPGLSCEGCSGPLKRAPAQTPGAFPQTWTASPCGGPLTRTNKPWSSGTWLRTSRTCGAARRHRNRAIAAVDLSGKKGA